MDLAGAINDVVLTIQAHAGRPRDLNPSTSIFAQQTRDSSR
jgi:hypothetical protein